MAAARSQTPSENLLDAPRAVKTGFSLIEVLAAVAVLAFVYIALAEYAMRGLGAEGEAERRLRAATLADTRLAEIEAQLLLQTYPEVDIQESDEEDFHVVIEVSAFAPTLPEWIPKEDTGSTSAKSKPDGPSFLASENSTSDEAPLRKIVVRVEWPEGRSVQSASRTTLFFDKTANEEQITSLPVRLTNKKSKNVDPETGEELPDDETDLEFDAELDEE